MLVRLCRLCLGGAPRVRELVEEPVVDDVVAQLELRCAGMVALDKLVEDLLGVHAPEYRKRP
jgi:hypothetical protein